MRISGFAALVAGVAVACLLAVLALPARASGTTNSDAGAAVRLVPAALPRILDVPPDELSDSLHPAEAPPGDFTAAQYIDSSGCVFVRTGDGWLARVARDGAPLCGYPPTFSARGIASDPLAPPSPRPEPRAVAIQRTLAETIIPALQAGELVPGRSPDPAGSAEVAGRSQDINMAAASATDATLAAVSPPGSTSDPLGLAGASAHAGEVRRQMAAGSRAARLCDLIGASPAADARGAGTALGHCGTAAPSLAALSPPHAGTPGQLAARSAPGSKLARQEQGAPVTASDPATAHARERAAHEVPAAGGASSRQKPAVHGGRRAVQAAGKAAARPAGGAGMIPPGARYVQIGAFRDSATADRTARRLVGMGLPVVRSGGRTGAAQLIMVGPLDGREAIVRTIDRVRRAGFRDAYARR